MSEIIPTTLFVPARGRDIVFDENTQKQRFQLSASSMQRVETAVDYYLLNRQLFSQNNGSIIMSGGMATLSTGDRQILAYPEEREAAMMAARAIQTGIPEENLRIETNSTTTLENIIYSNKRGYFKNISPDNPLGVVTQEAHWPRINWMTQKVLGISQDAIKLIPAPGETDPAIKKDEEKLMRIAQFYGLAHSPEGMHRIEKIVGVGARVLIRLGIEQPPADHYLAPSKKTN